jgi:hypothetical protein
MNSEDFIFSIESNLTPLAPVVIPGIIKKQLELLGVTREDITPDKAKLFIDQVTCALELFIGPEGSSNARKLMMKKLRECCTQEEKENMYRIAG